MIVVFGASGGVGSAIVPLLGDDVVGVTRKQCNIEDERDVADYFDSLRPFGSLKVLNATGKLHNSMLHKQWSSHARDMLESTVMGAFHLLKHFRRVASKGSSIVMLSSVVGTAQGVPGAAMYGACKGAVEALVRSAAQEYGGAGLSVSVVRMGYFETGMIRRVPEDRQKALLETIPSGRWGHIAELAALVKFAFDWPYANGSVLEVHGGVV